MCYHNIETNPYQQSIPNGWTDNATRLSQLTTCNANSILLLLSKNCVMCTHSKSIVYIVQEHLSSDVKSSSTQSSHHEEVTQCCYWNAV